MQNDNTKHIKVDRHFIKSKLDSGLICTPYVSTQNQLADILNKGLNCINWKNYIQAQNGENLLNILKGSVKTVLLIMYFRKFFIYFNIIILFIITIVWCH